MPARFMSALGHKWTFPPLQPNVRFAPIAVISAHCFPGARSSRTPMPIPCPQIALMNPTTPLHYGTLRDLPRCTDSVTARCEKSAPLRSTDNRPARRLSKEGVPQIQWPDKARLWLVDHQPEDRHHRAEGWKAETEPGLEQSMVKWRQGCAFFHSLNCQIPHAHLHPHNR
jgi:hypothetical protein